MKVETTINSDKSIRIHVVSGKFDMNELLNVLDGLYSGSEQNLELDALWDLREAEDVGTLNIQHLDKLVNMVSRKWETDTPHRAALVVSRMVDFGLARMYEMRMESKSKNEIRVFNNMEQAVHWLSL